MKLRLRLGKVIIFLTLALVLAFNVTVPAFAQVTSSEVTCKVGEQITIEFEYQSVVGFEGKLIFSEENAVKSVDKIEITGFSESQVTYNPKTNLILAYRLSTQAISNCTVSITFTVSETFTEKNAFTFAMDYIVAQGQGKSEEGVDSVTVNVAPSQININELQILIKEAESKVKEEYTAASWERLNVALEEAYAAVTSNSQDIVNNAATKLRAAIDSLESLTYDYSALKAQIKKAEALKKEEYTSTSWADLEAALKVAKEKLTSKDQDAIDDATEKLAEAIATLVKINNSDITKLLEVIAEAEALNESSYTEESWARLRATLHMAKKYCLTTTDQDIVDAYVEALRAAIDALVPLGGSASVDYTILNTYISTAESLNKNEYTAESWAKLEEALENGKKALSSRDQAVVNAAVNKLRNAINGLVKKGDSTGVDYSKLIAKMEEAEALDHKKYTADSWANLIEKLTAGAQALLSDSQSVVDSATDAIDKAIKALVLKTDAPVVTVDYTKLQLQISIAEALNESGYTKESWTALTSALVKAKAALSSKDQKVVDDAASALEAAINSLVLAGNASNVDY